MHQQLELILLQVNARNLLSMNYTCSKPSLAGFNICLSVGQLKDFSGYAGTFIECAIAGVTVGEKAIHMSLSTSLISHSYLHFP